MSKYDQNKTYHIVCYSGGHSSALVAIEVVRKFGKENVILLNHDINSNVEEPDIKRFKNEIAAYLGLEITYANHPEWDTKDQFDVCVDARSFVNPNDRSALCTNRLKTKPFTEFLKEEFPMCNLVAYYGFDANEGHRISRRESIMIAMGYDTDYPLARWERSILSSKEIGIEPPNSYSQFKHANCTGCLKSGKQHWFVVYCNRPDIFEKAKASEEKIGHSIIKGNWMKDLEPTFAKMKAVGIVPTEHMGSTSFWNMVKKKLSDFDLDTDTDKKPCECVF